MSELPVQFNVPFGGYIFLAYLIFNLLYFIRDDELGEITSYLGITFDRMKIKKTIWNLSFICIATSFWKHFSSVTGVGSQNWSEEAIVFM